ncbi:MAG: murein hydrolase activator EnvC family protein [Clostridium sp.]
MKRLKKLTIKIDYSIIIKIISVLTLITIFSFQEVAFNVFAADLKTEKKQIEKEIEAKEKEKKEVASESKKISNEIKEIEKELQKKEAEEKNLEQEVENLSTEISDKEKEVKEAKEKVKTTEEIIKRRIRSKYMRREPSIIEMAVNSGNMLEFFSNYNMTKEVVKMDNKLIVDFNNDKQKIDVFTQELTTKKKLVEEKKREVVKAKKQTEETREKRKETVKKLDETQKEIIKKMDSLKEKRAAVERQIEENVRIAMRRYNSQIARSSGYSPSSDIGGSNNQSSGGLLFPLSYSPLRISTYFGETYDTGYQGPPHTGLDLPAPIGTPVRSMADGVVLVAGWNDYGYGKYVVIYHPRENLTTLYAHGVKYHVTPGTHVKKGQRILSVGSTGYSTGPHLHFEIRPGRMGRPVNPLNYFRGLRYTYIG